MENWMQILLLLSLSGSALGLLLMVLERLLGKQLPKAVFYYAWLPILLRLALPVPGLVPLSGELPMAHQTPVSVTAAPIPTLPPTSTVSVTPVPMEQEPLPEPPASPVPAEADSLTTVQPVQPQSQLQLPQINPWAVLGLVWAAGATISFGRKLRNYLQFRSLVVKSQSLPDGAALDLYNRLKGPNAPALFRCGGIPSPMLVGPGSPKLLLPEHRFEPGVLAWVYRHELMHHQRKDLWLKWASELIFSLHWFNPLMGCFRKELNRCCELSCDEAVLRQCTTEQRKDYGLTLLELAAIGCAPQTTLATGFSQPKKDLKERLVELMNWKPKGIAALLAAAALLVSLCACGSLLGPAKQGSKTDFPTAGNEQDQLDHPEFWAAMETASKNIERPDDDSYLVDTVDEFLMALGSDRTIVLDPGTYLLSDSSAYSINSDAMPFRWQEVNDGFQLVIDGLDNLTIQGADRETTELLTAPRGAHTLNFRNCDDLSISGLTIGHTTAPSECMGSVIAVENVENGTIDDCVLFGCGTWAVNALASSSLTVQNSDLTDCSAGAVYAVSCNEVTVDHCRVFDNIKMPDVHPLFDFFTSRNCVVSNCDIRDNAKLYAVSAYNCDSVYFLGNQLDGNQFTNSVFSVDQPIIVEGCSFGDISKGQFFSETYPALVYYAIAQTGRSLTETELSSMKHQTVLGVPYQEETPELTFSDKKPVGDTTAVDVSTVDEFLAAIGDNRTIYLAEGVYDLTQAQGYGTTWGDHYQWVRCSDGYELVIQGVENLHLIGNGQDNTQLFGNASSGGLSISYCEDLSISNLCLGDREGSKGRQSPPLSLQNSRNLTISQCRLSGGTFGLSGFMLQNMTMERTTIDDCSDPAIYLNFCQDILINDCTIPEFPAPYNLYRSENVRLNGETISSP